MRYIRLLDQLLTMKKHHSSRLSCILYILVLILWTVRLLTTDLSKQKLQVISMDLGHLSPGSSAGCEVSGALPKDPR